MRRNETDISNENTKNVIAVLKLHVIGDLRSEKRRARGIVKTARRHRSNGSIFFE